jgi:D-3-phosphoglycerate dehydrogenase
MFNPAQIEVMAKLAPHLTSELSLTALATDISVSNTPKAVDAATANTAIFLILGALRRAWIPQQALREGKWRGASPLGRDPHTLTLGILGMGGIGTATAQRAAALGFKLQYHNRRPVADLDQQFTAAQVPNYVSFDELLETSDVISVHLPLGPATQGLVGTKEFEQMKDGVIIVNTARGAIIDEEALAASLESGKVWSVGLDVYEKEPEINPKLIKHPGAVLLPHIGTATIDTQVSVWPSRFCDKNILTRWNYRRKWRYWLLIT